MKSGILATTTLFAILGSIEQVQAQIETDRDYQSDVTRFSALSDQVPGGTVVPESNHQIMSLAWQTDFGAKSEAIAPTKELASLSVTEADAPLLADVRNELKDNDLADWSTQFRPHVPPHRATPARKPDESFPQRDNRSRARTSNYTEANPQDSVYRQRQFATSSPITSPFSVRDMAALSTQSISTDSIHQPEIPPLAAATTYLPEAEPSRPVFNGYGWPAQGVITSGFGWRWGRMHNGIDIAAPIGTPIVAAADGVVIASEWNSGGYGNLVEIEHPDGSTTLYAHNSENRVRVGQVVKKGQLIALMGSTGYSTGPHLHFELRLPGQGAVNPSAYLPSSRSVAHQHW
jgi:murein DD-endopeptidase MepM/ murein hydrolase activator NlpD